MAFQVQVKNEPPETGFSDRGRPRDTLEEALTAARTLAKGKDAYGRAVQIVSDDGVTVIQVIFEPGEVLGVDDDDVVTRAPAVFRTITDSRTNPTKVNKDTDEIEVGTEKGDVKVVEEEVK